MKSSIRLARFATVALLLSGCGFVPTEGNSSDSPNTEAFVVSIDSPADGYLIFDVAPLRASVADNPPAVEVEFFVEGESVGLAARQADGSYGLDWDTTSMPDGDVTITARAVDEVGNSGSAEASAVVGNEPVGLFQLYADLDAGILSLDDWALYLVFDSFYPEFVPSRYRSANPEDQSGTVEMMDLAVAWEQISPERQELISAYMEVYNLFLASYLMEHPEVDPRDVLAGIEKSDLRD